MSYLNKIGCEIFGMAKSWMDRPGVTNVMIKKGTQSSNTNSTPYLQRIKIQIDDLPFPQHNLDRGIHVQEQPKRNHIRAGAFDQLPLVFHQQMAEDDLELVGSEEAPGTRMLAVAKTHLCRRGADQVRDVVLVCVAPLHKAVRVKPQGVIIVLLAQARL